MQPVNGYDMKTKIDTANRILFAEELNSLDKKSSVTFSANLYEFEPDINYCESERSEPSIIEELAEPDETIPEEEDLVSEVDEIESKLAETRIEEELSPADYENMNKINMLENIISSSESSLNTSDNTLNDVLESPHEPIQEIMCQKHCKEFQVTPPTRIKGKQKLIRDLAQHQSDNFF